MHSVCYQAAQQCTHNNKTYWTGIRVNRSPAPTEGGNLASSQCISSPGAKICWNLEAPLGYTDGGGIQDRVREIKVQQEIKQQLKTLYPELNHHPLVIPENRGDLNLNPRTQDLLELTHALINSTNPNLACDCWLCPKVGAPRPLAVIVNTSDPVNLTATLNCTMTSPILVQLMPMTKGPCVQAPPYPNASQTDIGSVSPEFCSLNISLETPMDSCPPEGMAMACGGGLAYSFLPANWMGLCVFVILLPNIDIISGNEPLPVPSFDYIRGKSKRAIQMIPLLATLGITTGLATGTAALGIATHGFRTLSLQLINDVQILSDTLLDIQKQLDSLVEVVLQNRRGLDLLTAEKGGICLFLQERCCFYANKSGIVQDKIRNLQEQLNRRREELRNNPLWTGLNGLLPYLLPLLGPLLAILLVISFGPWAFRRITAFIKGQIDDLAAKPIQVHYHGLELEDREAPYGQGGFDDNVSSRPF
ncbi:syncytin-1-like [Nannospalax galili]|uniref:syncytin-1-like n=1 Tax=Nannospalax galili TaxID=1026970 RepID=UPI00081A108B|nr:syncytin-1-like [Nannospalax galili]